MEGGSRVEKKETDGGWCKLWMQPAISKRKKERQGESSSHAYQIAHLPHFLIMVGEQTHIQSALCVCARVCVRVCVCSRGSLYTSSMSACVSLCCAVKRSLSSIGRVPLQLFRIFPHWRCSSGVSARVNVTPPVRTHTHTHTLIEMLG